MPGRGGPHQQERRISANACDDDRRQPAALMRGHGAVVRRRKSLIAGGGEQRYLEPFRQDLQMEGDCDRGPGGHVVYLDERTKWRQPVAVQVRRARGNALGPWCIKGRGPQIELGQRRPKRAGEEMNTVRTNWNNEVPMSRNPISTTLRHAGGAIRKLDRVAWGRLEQAHAIVVEGSAARPVVPAHWQITGPRALDAAAGC